MVKHILASGCSFTAGGTNKLIKDHINCWPTRLSELLDCKVTNLAVSGAGNTQIVDSIIKEVCKHPKKYDLVVVGFTEAMRLCFPNANLEGNYTSMQPFREVEDLLRYKQSSILSKRLTDWYYHSRAFFSLGVIGQIFMGNYHNPAYQVEEKKIRTWENLDMWFDRWLINILTLQNFLETQGVNYIFGQGPDIMGSSELFQVTWDETNDRLRNHVYKSKIVENICYENWVNFPPAFTHLYEMIVSDNIVNQHDFHPNVEGHKFIASKYYEKYKEVYGS